MGLPDPARDAPAVDSPGKGLDRLQERLLLAPETSAGRFVEADPTTEPVHGQGLGADQRGQGTATEALQRLELEGPVLALTEARREPCIDIVGGPDMRNSPAITDDLNLFDQAIQAKPPLGLRQPPAQRQPEKRSQETHPSSSRLNIEAAKSAAWL